jgi:hypothetical protein
LGAHRRPAVSAGGSGIGRPPVQCDGRQGAAARLVVVVSSLPHPEAEAGGARVASASGQASRLSAGCNAGAGQNGRSFHRPAHGPTQRIRRARRARRRCSRGREPGAGRAWRTGRGEVWNTWPITHPVSGGARRGCPVGDGAGLRQLAVAVDADARSPRASTASAGRCAADGVRYQRRADDGSLFHRA